MVHYTERFTMQRTKRALIVGGTGTIGHAIATYCTREKDIAVACASRGTRGIGVLRYSHHRNTHHILDVTHQETFDEQVDEIFNFHTTCSHESENHPVEQGFDYLVYAPKVLSQDAVSGFMWTVRAFHKRSTRPYQLVLIAQTVAQIQQARTFSHEIDQDLSGSKILIVYGEYLDPQKVAKVTIDAMLVQKNVCDELFVQY